MRGVPDDDEVRPAMATSPCGSKLVLSFAVQGQTSHTWSDRASNYFVSGEDDIRPGSIPGNTRSPFLYSPLPPLRGQPTVKYYPRWQPN
jgi:hypothetical protein